MSKTVFAVLLLTASAGWCQTPAKDADTTQTLLTEVRELRLAIEGMTVASQRVQIALYALQMQDASVARAEQRVDAARSKCASIDENRRHMAQTIQQAETASVAPGNEETATKQFKEHLAQLKGDLDVTNSESETCRATEAEAANRLQAERIKLTELQDRIGRLDKALEQLGGAPK